MSYEFRSSGSCARCDATEGFYEDEPGRPHPNCRCAITQLVGGHIRTYDFYMDEWDDSSMTVTYHYYLYVECCEGLGATFQDDVEISFPTSMTMSADGVEQWEIALPEDQVDEQVQNDLEAAFQNLEQQCNCFLCC